MKNRLRTAAMCGMAALGIAAAQAADNDSKTSAPVGFTQEEIDKSHACQENLARMDGAKEQFALEYRLSNGSPATWANLLDPEAKGKLGNGYLKRKMTCPSGGAYTLNTIGQLPVCSLGKTKNHALEDGEIATTTTVSRN